MKELIFVLFDDEGGGYNAVEGKFNLIVVGDNRNQLIAEIEKTVREHFGDSDPVRIVLREVVEWSFNIYPFYWRN